MFYCNIKMYTKYINFYLFWKIEIYFKVLMKSLSFPVHLIFVAVFSMFLWRISVQLNRRYFISQKKVCEKITRLQFLKDEFLKMNPTSLKAEFETS